MSKNIFAIIPNVLLIGFIFSDLNAQKSQAQVECRLLEDDFCLPLLQYELEGIKNAFVPRSNDSKFWHGIPLKNILGTTDGRGLFPSCGKCYPTKYLDEVPYIKLILEEIEERFNTEVGLVRIVKLPGESALCEHTDGKIFDIYSGKIFRLHIPIISSPGAEFIINKKAFYLEPGKLYFTNVSLPHFALNNGNNDRIHLIIDVFASDELRDFIVDSEEVPFNVVA